MTAEADHRLRGLPSVDDVLKAEAATLAVARFGRPAAVMAVRQTLDATRAALRAGKAEPSQPDAIASAALAKLAIDARSNLRPVFNLTGTVLHTNLGRALLAEAAIEAAVAAMRDRGRAGVRSCDRQARRARRSSCAALLCELTGAEDATVVNNNAAAVLLVLNTLAKGREAIVSRGELIEIGGAFRMPDIMARAGARLVEVGTTNRTHLKDYAEAIGAKTGLVLKVHTSNYRIEGFTKEVGARELAATDARARRAAGQRSRLRHARRSVALGAWRMNRPSPRRSPTAPTSSPSPATSCWAGRRPASSSARKDLIAKINRNPMKRALRVDKIRLAALEATLRLYRDPDRLAEHLPTMRLLARPQAEIEAQAHRLVADRRGEARRRFHCEVVDCASQIGSGALPLETRAKRRARRSGRATPRGAGRALERLAAALAPSSRSGDRARRGRRADARPALPRGRSGVRCESRRA